MRSRIDLDHALQLRLSKSTVSDIDEVVATIRVFFKLDVLYTRANCSSVGSAQQSQGSVR